MTIEQVLREFVTYKRDIEGRSMSSINNYTTFLWHFIKTMGIETYDELINTKAQVVRDWLSTIAETNGASSRNNKLTAIKQFFLFLEEEKEIEVDRQISKIKFAKMPKKETKYIDEGDMELLLRVIENERVKAGVAIIENCGVRFSELIQLTCSDIERGEATIVGKGNKERKIYFTPQCVAICRRYMQHKRQHIIERTGVDTDLLFISDEGTLMTRQSFSASLKHYAKKIGICWAEGMSPHKLRHSCITAQLNSGTPIQVVRDMVGHANISTTDRYSHSSEEAVKNAMLGVKIERN